MKVIIQTTPKQQLSAWVRRSRQNAGAAALYRTNGVKMYVVWRIVLPNPLIDFREAICS